MSAPTDRTKPKPGESYHDRVQGAVLDAIISASTIEASDGARIATLMSGDICDALIGIMALMLATSPDAAAPDALRELCGDYAELLYRRTRAAQAHPKLKTVFAGGVHVASEPH